MFTKDESLARALVALGDPAAVVVCEHAARLAPQDKVIRELRQKAVNRSASSYKAAAPVAVAVATKAVDREAADSDSEEDFDDVVVAECVKFDVATLTQTTGGTVWDAALLLAHWLAAPPSPGSWKTPAKHLQNSRKSSVRRLRLFGLVGVREATRPGVEDRQYEQGQQGRADDSADHDGGQRPLYFGARTGRDRHRHEAERCDERGHQHWTQPLQSALAHGLRHGAALAAQPLDERDDHQPVQHGHAGQGDEADAGADGERDVAQYQRGDDAKMLSILTSPPVVASEGGTVDTSRGSYLTSLGEVQPGMRLQICENHPTCSNHVVIGHMLESSADRLLELLPLGDYVPVALAELCEVAAHSGDIQDTRLATALILAVTGEELVEYERQAQQDSAALRPVAVVAAALATRRKDGAARGAARGAPARDAACM